MPIDTLKFATPQAFSGGADFSPLSGIADTITDKIQREKAAQALANANPQAGAPIAGAVGPTSTGGPQGPTPLQQPGSPTLGNILQSPLASLQQLFGR